MTATYESRSEGKKEEEKTVKLDSSQNTINIIPNILIPISYVDEDGYPIFEKIQQFVDNEIEQIKAESKM